MDKPFYCLKMRLLVEMCYIVVYLGCKITFTFFFKDKLFTTIIYFFVVFHFKQDSAKII